MAPDQALRSREGRYGPDHPQWDTVLDPDGAVRAYVHQQYHHHLD
ncbi:hypothetical protein K353_06559 [Kitasatospora sp. SolWspMP-SS2h]|nr:hypothetical protein [Kitasatospora sp. SolWspMP-SS2h]RAJ29854.1 hypothetical protein K353_06559 [Kitasatospora sp. SolWspMP-SS2h]